MNKQSGLLFFSMLFLTHSLLSQQLTQTVRGKVIDEDSKYPLVGANIILLEDSTQITGTTTNEDGQFKLEEVPVGRRTFKISYIGYKTTYLKNIEVNSAKERILNISLESSTESLKTIEIFSKREGNAANDMAPVSSRGFTVDETERYAGSRGDPARMASNFAGVQGADDSRNDLVIRGNSPQGVLWQLEGINIPNPNHFNIPGTAGGPVGIINNKILANSDFYTGAFPAEFGNTVAGIFDLNLRNGNDENYEFSAQAGFLGMEAFGEGPISRKNGSSFLFSYRYSTLSLFEGLGIDIGTEAIPRYQDLSFKANFPLKNQGNIAVFGIGGTSIIDIKISDQKKPQRNIYGEYDRDQEFGSDMGTTGITYNQPINQNTFIKASFAASTEKVDAFHELVYRHVGPDNYYEVDSLVSLLDYTFQVNKYSGHTFFYKSLDEKNTLNAGLNADLYGFNFIDSIRNVNPESSGFFTWRKRWDANSSALLIQPFIQWKHKFAENLDFNAGIHSQYFTLNQSFSPVEPRASLDWNIDKSQTAAFGFGIHSQMQPPYIYFYGNTTSDGQPRLHNKHIGFTRSNHYVLSYNNMLTENLRLKTETYYQNLYDIPVEKSPSSFSMINTGSGFTRFFPDSLKNTGKGENYGLELTLEKFFSNQYLFMVTGALFESKYRGSDGVWRDTEFNGNYSMNALFTREFNINDNARLSAGAKTTLAGGRRYGPVDMEASEKEREVIFIDDKRNSRQFENYFRTDLKIKYLVNRSRITHEIALDLVNIFDTKNVLKLTYAPNDLKPDEDPVRKEYQLGFLPIFYYKIDF